MRRENVVRSTAFVIVGMLVGFAVAHSIYKSGVMQVADTVYASGAHFILYYRPFGEGVLSINGVDDLKKNFAQYKIEGVIKQDLYDRFKEYVPIEDDTIPLSYGSSDITLYLEIFGKDGSLTNTLAFTRWDQGVMLFNGNRIRSDKKLYELVRQLLPLCEVEQYDEWLQKPWVEPGFQYSR